MRTNAYGRRFYFYAPFILIALGVFGAATMLLWNAIMPLLFNLPIITFWQAVGLLVLSRLLFGLGRSHSPWGYSPWRAKLRDKVAKMTPEERREFYKKMHTMRHSWHREDLGKAEAEQKEQMD